MIENFAALLMAAAQPAELLPQAPQTGLVAQRQSCDPNTLAIELQRNGDPALRTFSCFAVRGFAVMSLQGRNLQGATQNRFALFVEMDGKWRFSASSPNPETIFSYMPEWAARQLRASSGWR